MPILLLIMILVPVFSFLLLLINFFCIKITQEPKELVTEKKQDCVISLKIKNYFILPLTPIKITGRFYGEESRDISEKVIFTDVMPLGEIGIEMPFKPDYRGEYTIGVESYELFDLFKLFKLRKKIKNRISIIVLPQRIELTSVRDINEAESEGVQGNVNSFNASTFSSFREYRMGDNLRHVHWKLTAKQGELVIKQMEQTINNNSVIFCDFTVINTEKDMNYYFGATDAVIESALAVVKKITDDGNSATVCWQGKEADEMYEITDGNDYWQLYYIFALLPSKPVEKSFEDLLLVSGNEINSERMVYLITNKVTDEFLAYLESSGMTERKNVVLILFNTTHHNTSHLEYLETETQIVLKLVNTDEIGKTLSQL